MVAIVARPPAGVEESCPGALHCRDEGGEEEVEEECGEGPDLCTLREVAGTTTVHCQGDPR